MVSSLGCFLHEGGKRSAVHNRGRVFCAFALRRQSANMYYLNISHEKSSGDNDFCPHLHEYLAFYILTG